MRKVALITDGWKRLFTYAWPLGIMQRLQETQEMVNLYIFNSTGNWSRDEGYNRAEYNIFNLPDFTDFDGIILELNNISSASVLQEVTERAKKAGIPVISIANELQDFYYVGIDNFEAMQKVIRHLHQTHHFSDFWFLMGPRDNYESASRLNGLMDYARKNGIEIGEDRIWCGSFDYCGGQQGFEWLWKQHQHLPDAIICVNDNVAVAACESAAALGFKVPEDVCITGFDNFDKASFYKPTITTVSHIREDAASKGMDVLLRIWAGEEVPRYSYTETDLICQESCDCSYGGGRDARCHLKEQIMYGIDREEFDKEVLSMEAEMMQCNTVEEMMYCITQCIPSLKCDAMYLVLDNHINDYKTEAEQSNFQELTPLNEAFLVNGYPDKMTIVFSYERDGSISLEKKEIQGIFPTFDFDEPRQDMLFLPLHFGERSVGYVAIRNAVYLMEKQYLFQIMYALTRSMENLHKKEMLTYMNRRLSALYMMDPLTGIYNRTGYMQRGEQSYQEAREKGEKLLILYADLDRLKYINDTFGHEYGDIAICAAARALMQCSSKKAIPARLGGDEFILIQEYVSREATDQLIERIRRTLKEDANVQKFPFPVDLSIGIVIMDPAQSLTLEECVKKADARMYAEKTRRRVNR